METLTEITTWLRLLPPATEKRRVRQSGRLVFFTGNNREQKFAAAKGLAADTGRPLHRVDLAEVVSKYIGETEKNLQAVFAKAQETGAILFFDEADALFGERTDVKDSHDRYANLEIGYWRKLSESFGGLVILSVSSETNEKKRVAEKNDTTVRFD